MNIYATVILVSLLLEFGVRLIVAHLSLISLLRKPAESFADLIDRDRYHQLQRYTAARTRLRAGSEGSYLAVLLLFWFNGGFRLLDRSIENWGFAPLVTGVLVIGAIAIGRALVALPFAAYFTFRIEGRFGFNNTTPQTFLSDLLKGTLVAAAVGGPVLAAILALLGGTGRYSWVYAWSLVAGVCVLLEILAPQVILPLFNKFEPIKNRQLQEAISSYAASVDFPLAAVSVMDASTRSSKSNAFFTGLGSNHRLVLEDTLISRHTVPELVAITAHEVGHFKQRHIPLRVSIEILQLGLFFLLMSLFLNRQGLFLAFYVGQPSVHLGVVFFTLLYSPVAFGWSILVNWIARKQEYAADAFAANTAGGTADLAEALRKLAADNYTQLAPHRFDVFLNYSHPTLRDRIRALSASDRSSEQLTICGKGTA